MATKLRTFVLCVLVLIGCSSEVGTHPQSDEDARVEEPRAGIYPSEHTKGGTLCGWIAIPKQVDGGTVWIDELVPCGPVVKDPISDPPIDEDGPAVDVPKGWKPPGQPGDPIPW